MDNLELENIILDLIDRKSEGSHWDFKEEWYSNNASLLHDIICMSNNLDNRDAYIIIGVSDEYAIKGIKTANRKNQQNILDLLRQKPRWAGGYIPEVYVKTIALNNHELDVIVIKQSNNTPFYLLEKYSQKSDNKDIVINGGAIYTRKGDTNTPKNSTADLYDTELLWKRRFGLLLQPSQRACFYLKDLDNWVRVDGETDKDGKEHFFFYYKPDPDYTVHLIELEEDEACSCDINDDNIGSSFYYLYSFCNISYHTDFSQHNKITVFYKEIPLHTAIIEDIDESRSSIVPPEYWLEAYYIKDEFRYLLFEFVFDYYSSSYSKETKEMIMRVIPAFNTLSEKEEFMDFISEKGFSYGFGGASITGEAQKRYNKTVIYEVNEDDVKNVDMENIANQLMNNSDLVANFAKANNKDYKTISRKLKEGKLLVDWLNEWRESN